MENLHYAEKLLRHLTNDEGDKIYDNEGIQNEVYDYYRKLYSSKDSDLLDKNLKQLLSNHNVQKLSTIESVGLEGPLTYIEVDNVSKIWRNNKSPGTDDFNVEFCKFLEKILVTLY